MAVTGTFFQATQPVSGTVDVNNFPASQPVTGTFFQATQPVSGTVDVVNYPATVAVTGTFFQATQPVSGTVDVNNFPASQPVTGTFFQATQPVSGTVDVNNFPATQAVSGTVDIGNYPASVTTSVNKTSCVSLYNILATSSLEIIAAQTATIKSITLSHTGTGSNFCYLKIYGGFEPTYDSTPVATIGVKRGDTINVNCDLFVDALGEGSISCRATDLFDAADNTNPAGTMTASFFIYN